MLLFSKYENCLISESGLTEDYETFEMLTAKDMCASMSDCLKYLRRNGRAAVFVSPFALSGHLSIRLSRKFNIGYNFAIIYVSSSNLQIILLITIRTQ